MQYLPSVNISGGWSGYTRTTRDEAYLIERPRRARRTASTLLRAHQRPLLRLAQPLPPDDCSRFAFTDTQRDAVLAANSRGPSTSRAAAPSADADAAHLQRLHPRGAAPDRRRRGQDARHQRREEELGRRATVATSFLALQTAYRSVGIEERNAAAAAEQLELAQERYRLGAGSILELTQAQATRARADQAHLDSAVLVPREPRGAGGGRRPPLR
jgi:outer membrane protein